MSENVSDFLTMERSHDFNGRHILRHVRAGGPGSVFMPSDFLTFGSLAAVDQAMSRLCRDSRLRRLAHGLYDSPRVHAQSGNIAPIPDAVAKAFARETSSQLQMTGLKPSML